MNTLWIHSEYRVDAVDAAVASAAATAAAPDSALSSFCSCCCCSCCCYQSWCATTERQRHLLSMGLDNDIATPPTSSSCEVVCVFVCVASSRANWRLVMASVMTCAARLDHCLAPRTPNYFPSSRSIFSSSASPLHSPLLAVTDISRLRFQILQNGKCFISLFSLPELWHLPAISVRCCCCRCCWFIVNYWAIN